MSDRELLHYKVIRKGSPQAPHTQKCCMCSRRIFQNEEYVVAFCEHSAHYDCALENRKDEPSCPGHDCVSRIAPTPVRVFEEELSATAVCKICNKADTTLSFGCGHWFHNHCVEHESHAWFIAQCFELNALQDYRNWPCPSCRAPVYISRLVELFPLQRDEIAKHIRGQVLTHINSKYEEDMKKTENTWRRLFL